MLSYKEFCNDPNMEQINESKVSDITNKILNKSRELGDEAKKAMRNAWNMGKRETRQTAMALDIISKKMLKGRPITDEEKKFLKGQAMDIVRLLPLIAITGIPAPIPITPFLVALGRKYNFDMIPRNQIEPDAYKDKDYNIVRSIKKRRNKRKNINEKLDFSNMIKIEDHINEIEADMLAHNPHDEGLNGMVDAYNKKIKLLKPYMEADYSLKGIKNNLEIGKFLETQKMTDFFRITIARNWTDTKAKYLVKIFDVEEGKAAVLTTDRVGFGDKPESIFFDQAFIDSNYFKSLNIISKYNI